MVVEGVWSEPELKYGSGSVKWLAVRSGMCGGKNEKGGRVLRICTGELSECGTEWYAKCVNGFELEELYELWACESDRWGVEVEAWCERGGMQSGWGELSLRRVEMHGAWLRIVAVWKSRFRVRRDGWVQKWMGGEKSDGSEGGVLSVCRVRGEEEE
ncbi:hypothetical protein GOBAR_DD10744 [Gossypium barbadense]|nr:hypothetical protein GOBAR_DD10744 [Gossypium barbadense]